MQLTLHRRAARAALHPAPQSDQGSWGGGELQTQSGWAVYESEIFIYIWFCWVFLGISGHVLQSPAFKSVDFIEIKTFEFVPLLYKLCLLQCNCFSMIPSQPSQCADQGNQVRATAPLPCLHWHRALVQNKSECHKIVHHQTGTRQLMQWCSATASSHHSDGCSLCSGLEP